MVRRSKKPFADSALHVAAQGCSLGVTFRWLIAIANATFTSPKALSNADDVTLWTCVDAQAVDALYLIRLLVIRYTQGNVA